LLFNTNIILSGGNQNYGKRGSLDLNKKDPLSSKLKNNNPTSNSVGSIN
jgi:hypothetical protein